jgi:hypothetical protein
MKIKSLYYSKVLFCFAGLPLPLFSLSGTVSHFHLYHSFLLKSPHLIHDFHIEQRVSRASFLPVNTKLKLEEGIGAKSIYICVLLEKKQNANYTVGHLNSYSYPLIYLTVTKIY